MECENIVRLYSRVLENDILEYNVPESAIQVGIKSMTHVYKPLKGKKLKRSVVADFNDIAHRCAYLHKFASLHTAMVRDLMFSAIRQNYDFFYDLLFSEVPFKMCSLGGGPGSDVVGILASLLFTFNHGQNLDISATVIDYMPEWSKSFQSIIKELYSGGYGNLGRHYLRWRYMGANLLKSLDPEVKKEISSASLITAVKFVSATNCKDTEFMVENIFYAMKPGAVIFFIDNAGGGFREVILHSAIKFNFIPVFGPIQREDYVNEVVKVRRFGYTSCHKTSISVAILQKPYEIQPRLNSKTVADADGVLFPVYSRKVDKDCYFSSSTGFATPKPEFPLDQEKLKREEDHTWGLDQNIPLTPYVFQLSDNALTPDSGENGNSKNGYVSILTPDTPRRGGRNRIPSKNRCLPLSKIKHWRHHLSTKLDSFKSRLLSKCGKKKK